MPTSQESIQGRDTLNPNSQLRVPPPQATALCLGLMLSSSAEWYQPCPLASWCSVNCWELSPCKLLTCCHAPAKPQECQEGQTDTPPSARLPMAQWSERHQGGRQ